LVGWLVGWRDEISRRRARGRTDGRTERRALRDGSTVRVETRRVRVERTPNGESVVVMDDAKEGDDGDDTAAKKT